MRLVTTMLLLLLIPVLSVSQVQTRSSKNSQLGASGFFGSPQIAPLKEVQRPDASRLLQNDRAEQSSGLPFRFGYAVDADYTLENSGRWIERLDGRVWKLRIRSAGAYSINLVFEQLFLPRGAMLYIYNETRTMVYGPVTSRQLTESGRFSTDLIQGDVIILELFEPGDAEGAAKLKIEKVVHGYKNLFDTPNIFGQSLSCNNDVNCPAGSGWQNESDGVAMILLDNGQRICSGALINNACQDFTPNILTAFHCIDIGDEDLTTCDAEVGNGSLSAVEINRAEDWVFRFKYKSPSCNGPEPNSWVTYNGSTFSAGWFDTDFALVEMNNRPDGFFTGIKYLGWSRNTAPPSSGATIHHPSGDVMKISLFNAPPSHSNPITWNAGCRLNATPANSHWSVTLNNGTTEPGSSGAPLFDQNHRVIGQLHGGSNGCAPVSKHFGKLDHSWTGGGTVNTQLSAWLTNDPSVTETNTILIPVISGTDVLCSSNSNFTISNVPAGQTVSWTVSPPEYVNVSSGTGSTATIAANPLSFGEATITFTLHGGPFCPNSATFSKAFFVGGIPEDRLFIRGDEQVCYGSYSYWVDNRTSVPIEEYHWEVPAGWTITWQTGNYLYISADPGISYPQTLEAFVRTNCGGWTGFQGPWYLTVWEQPGCTYPFSYSVSPNPASESITIAEKDIQADERDAQTSSKEYEIVELRLYDNAMRLVRSQPYTTPETKIPVTDLLPGSYILHVIKKDGIDQEHIIIQKTL